MPARGTYNAQLVPLPCGLRVGDWLFARNQGAYTSAGVSDFNGMQPRPSGGHVYLPAPPLEAHDFWPHLTTVAGLPAVAAYAWEVLLCLDLQLLVVLERRRERLEHRGVALAEHRELAQVAKVDLRPREPRRLRFALLDLARGLFPSSSRRRGGGFPLLGGPVGT